MLFIISLLSGCGETTAPEKVQLGNQETQAAAGSAPAKTSQVFSIGDTVKMGNLQFIVNNVRTSGGEQFIKPAQGNTYLLVDCTITNTSSEAAAISSLLMFKLVDGEGYNYNTTIGPETKSSLDGELAPGRKMRGEVCFEIPAQAKSLELVFEPNVFGFGQAIYKIK